MSCWQILRMAATVCRQPGLGSRSLFKMYPLATLLISHSQISTWEYVHRSWNAAPVCTASAKSVAEEVVALLGCKLSNQAAASGLLVCSSCMEILMRPNPCCWPHHSPFMTDAGAQLLPLRAVLWVNAQQCSKHATNNSIAPISHAL